jgi:hypothetical protein
MAFNLKNRSFLKLLDFSQRKSGDTHNERKADTPTIRSTEYWYLHFLPIVSQFFYSSFMDKEIILSGAVSGICPWH